MKKIKNMCERILPSYSYLLILTMIVFNCIVYFGTRFFTSNMTHHTMYTPLDSIIPFCPAFISIYILAYVQWIFGYVFIARENRYIFKWIAVGEIIAKAIAFICFVTFPTTIDRPEITSSDLWSNLTSFIYSSDAPDNLFPSVHCLESWVCFRGSMYLIKPGKWYKYICLVFTLMVFASTVFVKQHVVLDIIGAVCAVEAGLFVSRKVCDLKGRVYL